MALEIIEHINSHNYNMKTGTKSLLYGAHCFLLHPVFVAIAWIKLYGFPWDPRIWIAFFVHDLGYWGKQNMDGPEGKIHPELGARIMHFLFDGWQTDKCVKLYVDEWVLQLYLNAGWKVTKKTISPHPIWLYEFVTLKKRVRKTTWQDFARYHSRYYTKKKGATLSKLCFADKLSITLVPEWLYLPMTNATGEILEYMVHAQKTGSNWTPVYDQKIWYKQLCAYMYKWVYEHKETGEETWLEEPQAPKGDVKKETDPLRLLREETFSNEETNEMTGRMIRKEYKQQFSNQEILCGTQPTEEMNSVKL